MDYSNAPQSNGSFGYDGAYDTPAPQSTFPPDTQSNFDGDGGGGGGGGGGGASGGGGGIGRDMIQNTVAQGLEQFKSAGSHLADVTHINDPETKMAATR